MSFRNTTTGKVPTVDLPGGNRIAWQSKAIIIPTVNVTNKLIHFRALAKSCHFQSLFKSGAASEEAAQTEKRSSSETAEHNRESVTVL